MANQSQNHNGHQGKTPYERAVLGFPNYWYPACGAREVGTRPKPIKLLGEALVFLRRQGKVYAIQDECPHRGSASKALLISIKSCSARNSSRSGCHITPT